MKPPIPEPDPKHPDMSTEVIDQRLRQLAQVYRLGMSLRNAKLLGSINKPAEETPSSTVTGAKSD